MFGLEMYSMPLTVQFPLPLPICQHPKDLGVVRGRIEAIKCPRVHGLQMVEFVYGLRTEVNLNPMHPNLFIHVRGNIGIEFSDYHSGSWCRELAQCPPTLVRNRLAKEVIGVVKPLLLNKRPIFGDEAKLLGRSFIENFFVIVSMHKLLTCPTSLCGHL